MNRPTPKANVPPEFIKKKCLALLGLGKLGPQGPAADAQREDARRKLITRFGMTRQELDRFEKASNESQMSPRDYINHLFEDDQTYTTFIRSCRNWKEFGSARKKVVDTGLSWAEAREACKDFNDNRTEAEEDAGTKMEFTASDNHDSEVDPDSGETYLV